MKFFPNILGVLFLLFTTTIHAQIIHINANIKNPEIIEGSLNMGHSGPKGKELTVNNKYMQLAGKPILPVMGEIHFSRCNPEKWEDLILKMKANGITIISTYVFWIHHEEIEGVFKWEGQNNLRAFIELCKKHNVWAYPRIGPWCHGEVRNGGLPDWILKNNTLKVRTNDEKYMEYVDRWYNEISKQLDGLYYKDGGPVIGIQLENEYWRGKSGEQHIMALKTLALKYGMDVPMYTVTGWRNASVPENEVIPLWGGYPAAPWNTDLNKITSNESYVFSKPVNDQSIGHKEESSSYKPDYSLYPYFTCELGVGNQISDHRRPIIDPVDGVTIATSSVASGSNLPGYYVFAGGTNPIGTLTTLHEERLETGYWNDYPIKSYDFQAAIKETGEIADSYKKLKPLHYFLSQFGEQLAPMTPVIPENNTNPDSLQYAFRVKDDSGFLFVSNYYRGYEKSTKNKVQFHIQLQNEVLKMPSTPINIEDRTLFIWPVNMPLGDNLLKYASAQPICKVENKKTTDWYFFQTEGITPEFLLDSKNIKTVTNNGTQILKNNAVFFVKPTSLGLDNPIIIKNNNGTIQRIFVLTQEQKDDFWYFKNNNKTYAFLSSTNLALSQNNNLQAFSTNTNDEIIALNCNLQSDKKTSRKTINTFQHYSIQNPEVKWQYTLEEADLIEKARWLKVSASNFHENKILYHKQFFKDFTIENSSAIKKANFHFFSNEKGMLRINGSWLNQNIKANAINTLDLTGYLQKGKNDLFLDFPYTNENKVFVGVIEVEFYNTNKTFIPTDATWFTTEQYKIPAVWDAVNGKTQATVVDKPTLFANIKFSNNSYKFTLKNNLANYKNVYLGINYSGNKIQCYNEGNLVADNFNNGTTWSINLTDIVFKPSLTFNLIPFETNPKIYFDQPIEMDQTLIKDLAINAEYSNNFQIKE